MAVESQFLFVYNKMKSQVLALWLLVSTTIADDLIEEQVKEAEVVKEDKGGVDKRAERLMDRLEDGGLVRRFCCLTRRQTLQRFKYT